MRDSRNADAARPAGPAARLDSSPHAQTDNLPPAWAHGPLGELPPNDAQGYALHWARRGWEIMPRLEVARGLLVDALHGSPRAGLLGEDETVQYWSDHPETSAFAVVTGATSGVLVLDCDQHAGGPDGLASLADLEARHGPLPPAPFVLTPSGSGRHLYFAWPEGREVRNGPIAPGVEILGDRMAATLPPSTKAGRPYLWALSRHPDWMRFTRAPEWLLELAAPPPRPEPKAMPRPLEIGERYIQAALDDELAAVRNAPPGHRNDQLSRSAWALSRFVVAGRLGAEEVVRVLVGAAPTNDRDFKRSEAERTVRGALRRRASS